MTWKISKILIATDGSEIAENAAKYAFELAKDKDASVYVVSVMDSSKISPMAIDAGSAARNENMEYARKIKVMGEKLGVKTEAMVHSGDPAKVIADLSKDYDLIVMSATGKSAVTRAFIGSVAEKVSRTAHCSVLLVRDH